MNYYDQQLLTRMFVGEQRVSSLFNQFISSVSPELKRWRENGTNSVWVRNQRIENLIDLRLNEFQIELLKIINNNSSGSWNLSGDKNDKMVRDFISGLKLSEVVKDGFFSRNLEALAAFQNRIDNGLSLSDRILQTAQTAKTQLEFYLQSGICTGQSADTISRDIRQLLQDPDKRFRRIRNDAGNLVPSKPMSNYHPGQGVYRSAYKNALRITSTETNMGYRLSDYERWQQLDFVLGFQVSRSRNSEPCEICDPLVGKYPKWFVFPGWHPFCICYAVPILMNHEDSARYFLAKYSKKYQSKVKPNYITEIPVAAKQFFADNPGYAQNSYAGKMNFSYQNNEAELLRAKGIAVDKALELLKRKSGSGAIIKKSQNIKDTAN